MITDSEVSDDIRKARDLLQDAIESLSEGFALYDDDRQLVMCNEAYRRMNQAVADILEPGLDWEILMRETARRGVYYDAIGREDAWIRERLENGVEYIQDYELNHTDGTSYLVSVHPTKLGGFVVTRTDVTEKKQAEALERDGDLLVRQVLEASPSAVVMARVGSGEIVYRSPAAMELFGKVKNDNEYYLDAAERADYITALLADGRVDEFKLTLINANGARFPAAIYGRLAEYKGEDVAVTTAVDLTKQAEAEALIRQVLEACPVPVQMTKAETGDLLFRSPQTTALFGTVENAKSYYLDNDERETYLEELRGRRAVVNRKARLRNAKGEAFWGAVSSNLIEFRGEEVIVSNTRDLTEELALQEELASQREMLFQNEKMSALGELLAGVAHELNNPLSIVVGHSLMLRDESENPDTLRRIEKISGAAERCAKIVKTFLAMARQQPTKMERVNIASVVATAVDVAGYGGAQDGIEIVSSISDDNPDILADADQITQVIINLILNAGHAISTSGVGDRISVSARLHDDEDYFEVAVEDNGPGIPESIRARIFEPFFTTKNVGDGTGIGLAFCHRIIHSHNGRIWLDDAHERGSRFCIALPIAKPSAVADSEPTDDLAPISSVNVLVVDDEEDVAAFIAEVVLKAGFSVDTVHSGAQAISRLEAGHYDVLLSDLNMPDVDGRGLFEALQARFPDMIPRTGFITGDTMGQSSQALLRQSQRPYLEKPVAPDDLLQLILGILRDLEDNEG